MIRYGHQDINFRDLGSVLSTLLSDFLTTGPQIDLFESRLSSFLGVETFVLNSGTAALHAAYKGIGIQPGDEIITPANTFIATQATAANLGAKVLFADIDLDTGLMNIESASSLISKKTKAIVLVDYAGQPCDLDEYLKLVEKRNIILIEDAAHSFGSKYKGRMVGSICDLTTFSFYPTKNITTGEGGALASKDESFFERSKTFARQGLVRNKEKFVAATDDPWHQEVQEFGLNYRMTDFQCALGISQLKRLSEFKTKRDKVRQRYIENLSQSAEVEIIKKKDYADPFWHLFPILLPKEKKKKAYVDLKSAGIQTNVNYMPAYRHPVFSNSSISPHNEIAEEFYSRELSLPFHTKLTMKQVDYICEVLLASLK